MTEVPLTEDDLNELLAMRHSIKSVLAHPRSNFLQFYKVIKELEKLHYKFKELNKKIPETDEYLVLDDLKILTERFWIELEYKLVMDESNVHR